MKVEKVLGMSKAAQAAQAAQAAKVRKPLSLLVAAVLALGLCPGLALADDAGIVAADDGEGDGAGAAIAVAAEAAAPETATPDVEFSLTAQAPAASESTAMQAQATTYSEKANAFVADSRWRNGTAWGDYQSPKLANFSSLACCAYVADFTKYVYGIDNPRGGTLFSNAQEIRDGDVLHIYNGTSSGHWLVVRYRNGNTLDTAEGNFSKAVYVCNDHYSISGTGIKELKISGQPVRSFEGWHFNAPSDTTPPTISNVRVSSSSATGYTVTATVSDNVGVTRVAFPTWTENNGQDDLLWRDGSISGNTATFTVNFSDHGNQTGCKYITHVYAYDAAGNQTNAGIEKLIGSQMKSGYDRVLPDGDYAIVLTNTLNSSTKWYLDIYGTTLPAASGTNVDIASTTGDPAELSDYELWHLTYKDGFYTITQKGANVALDLGGGGMAENANVQAYASNGTIAQEWAIVPNGDGYTVASKCNGFMLDNQKGLLEQANNVAVHSGNNSVTQRWSFVRVRESLAGKQGWKQSSTGTSSYASFPAGFDTGNALYKQYNKAKVAASETATAKRTVSTSRTGWIYYHWTWVASADAGSSNRLINASKCVDGGKDYCYFSAFYSTTDYPVYSGDSSVFECWRDVASDGSRWWFRVPVYKQTYTDYKKATVGAAEVSLSAASFTYDGKAKTPAVTVKLNGKTLAKGTDYTVSYKNNVKAGTATVVVSGIGGYKDSVTRTFTIKAANAGTSANSGGSAGSGTGGGSSSAAGVSKYKGKAAAAGFVDLDKGAWYMKQGGGSFPNSQTLYLDYTVGRGLMTGLDKTHFGPDGGLTRAQAAMVLFRLANPGAKNGADANATGLPDVESGAWYTRAVNWCFKNGVVTGFKDGRGRAYAFKPNEPVTREQLATMIARYCVERGGAQWAGSDVSRYNDAGSIGSWARQGVAFCGKHGIMTGMGTSGNFAPGQVATRCQMAKIIAVAASM